MSADSAGSRVGRWRGQILQERRLSELIGTVLGILADGRVTKTEALQLHGWIRENPEVAARWPVNILVYRLERVLEDGRIDRRERRHLAALLAEVRGLAGAVATLASDLPVDHPQPPVSFAGRVFVLAGEMAYGSHRACAQEIAVLGGRVDPAVSARTDFLVLGSRGGEAWNQAPFGSAVDEVVLLRSRGRKIAIVSEDHWVGFLPEGIR